MKQPQKSGEWIINNYDVGQHDLQRIAFLCGSQQLESSCLQSMLCDKPTLNSHIWTFISVRVHSSQHIHVKAALEFLSNALEDFEMMMNLPANCPCCPPSCQRTGAEPAKQRQFKHCNLMLQFDWPKFFADPCVTGNAFTPPVMDPWPQIEKSNKALNTERFWKHFKKEVTFICSMHQKGRKSGCGSGVPSR